MYGVLTFVHTLCNKNVVWYFSIELQAPSRESGSLSLTDGGALYIS